MVRARHSPVMNEKLQLGLAIALGAFLILLALFLVFGPPISVR